MNKPRFKVILFDDERAVASANFYSHDAARDAMEAAISRGRRADLVDLSLIDAETAIKIAPFIGATV